jgi:glyoxylase-like metal-dependent hydrolase (beta-lactamase superfamily II)
MTTQALPGTDWTRPGPHPVCVGVWRIPLPLPGDGLRAVNAYAVAHGDRVAVVDAGWALPSSEAVLEAALGELGYRLHQVSDWLVTHAHRDHYTQAVTLRRRAGGRITLGEGEQASLRLLGAPREDPHGDRVRMLRRAGAPGLAAQLLAFRPDHDPGLWEEPDRWAPDRARIPLGERELEAIETPGHTRGHLVYLDRGAGVLFAGDHVLPHITPSIGFEQAPQESPLRAYLASLRLLREMPDATLLPGHGPVTESVHARVDELLEHHRVRLDASLDAVDAGAHTAYEVASRLGWTRRGHRLADLDLFNATLAVLETEAHLSVLVERGLLRCTEVDGVRHYAR